MTKTVLTTYGFGLPKPDDCSNASNAFYPQVTVKRKETGEVVSIIDPDGKEEARPMTPEEKEVIDKSTTRTFSLPTGATSRYSALFLDRQEDALTNAFVNTVKAAKAAQQPVRGQRKGR